MNVRDRRPARSKASMASALALGTMLVAIAGCSILPPELPAPRLYLLSPKSTFDKNLPRVTWQLSIDPPIAESGLNTTRIAVMRKPYLLEYFERANWIDTAPRMVQRLLVESFENSRRIIGVGRQSVTLRADYGLITELREFQAESFGGRMEVHVRINAKLVKLPQRQIVSTLSAEHKVATEGPAIEQIVRAFDDALGKALKDVVSWALTAVPPNPVRRSRSP